MLTTAPRLTPIVAALPATIPFVGPEALERLRGVDIAVRIGANESLFGPSPRAVEAIRNAASSICLYGDPEGYALRRAIADHHGVALDGVVLGAGIDELLGLFVRAYQAPGEIAVMSEGGYPTFAFQVSGHGGRIETVPYLAMRNDPQALVGRARAVGAKILYLANPDNPTGSWLTATEQLAMLDHLPPDCLLMLDEAYAEFAPADAIPAIDPADPRIVRFRTFSKAHGMAGIRVAYAYGAPETILPIDRIRNHFGVNRLAQLAAIAALGDQDHVASVVAAVADGRSEYGRLAASLGFEALRSATNFVAIDVGTADRARAILAALLQDESVFIRMPGVAPLNRCIRVTVGRPEDRARFADSLQRVVSRLS